MGAHAVDMPDGYTHLGWIESDTSGKQWINTGYVPNAQSVIRASFRLGTRSGGWCSAFGVFNRNDNCNYGVVFRYYNSEQKLNGLFCNPSYGEAQVVSPADEDYEVELKSGGMTVNGEVKTISTQTGNLAEFNMPLYVFCECNKQNEGNPEARRHQVIRLYSMTIVESDGSTETLKRNFLPCIDTNGAYGLWDTVDGVFYGNQASGADFNGGGLKYILDSGVMTAYEGELPAGAMEGVASLEKVSAGTFGVGAYATLPATAVTAGELSFQNDAATAVTVSSLELYGGTALGFDVTASGCDSLSVSSLTLDSSVTSANPVTIKVNPYGVVGVENPMTLISGGNLAAADIDLFALDTTLPAVLEIDNGNLVLAPVPVDPSVWTGEGGNGNWSTAGNWADGVPVVGAPITLGVAAGGSTTMDISGYAAKSITIPATSGSYTHGGNALAVTGSFTDNSAAEQTFTMPLTLGVAGSPFTVTSAGNLSFTGAVTDNASTLTFTPAVGVTNKVAAISGSGVLAKSGDGVLELTAQNSFSGDVAVTGGTLLSDVAVPFSTAGLGNKISVSNGGTLDIGPASIAEDAVNYNSRTLEIGGHGVDGKGAVVYNVSGRHQYNAFHLAKLTADATVGGAAGRWDVRAANGQGTFDFNGYNLTKVGAGEFALSSVALVTGESPVSLNINEGNVLIESGATALGYGNAINVASGATLAFYQLVTPLEWAINFAGGSTLDAREATTAQNIFAGDVALGGGTVTMSVKNLYHATISGTVSGTGGIKKTNGGYLYFRDGAKTYSGGTEVAGGRLYVPSKDQLPGYSTEGRVSITGEGGIVLESTGWALLDFDALLSSVSILNWKGFVGYEAKEPVTLGTARTLSMGSLMLGGGEAPITITADITLSDGMLVTSGDVSVSGENTLVSVKRLELSDREAVLSVTNGASVEITSTARNVGDIVLGNVMATPPYVHRLYVENGSAAANPLPAKGAQTSSIFVGNANNAVGILEVGNGGYVAHRIIGAVPDWSRGAILIREGGTVVNCGGTGNNDGYISGNGYGFMENAGTYEVKGYSQVVNGYNTSRAVGVLYSSGNLLFTGEYDGELDVSRGGTGVVYQTSGTIEAVKNGFQLNSHHGNERGLAIWIVDGANAVTKTPVLYPVNKNNTTSVLTLREGGTLDYRVISPRNNNYGSLETQKFYLNMAGGFLKPQESGTVFKEGSDGRYLPNVVVAFEGGAGFDIGEGLTSTLNFPVSKPTGRGIASITPSSAAFAQEYIGAPFVNIEGDGYGATAVAIYDSTTRRMTGVKVTSPGCNYTTATAKLEGGRLDNNTAHDAAVTLTADGAEQTCGGLVKKGAGTLVVSNGNLPDNLPLTVLSGTLDLAGATYSTPELVLGDAKIVNGSVVAQKIRTIGNAFVSSNITLADDGGFAVESGTATVDIRCAGLYMKKFQCSDYDGVRALVNADDLDWSGAVIAYDFNTANTNVNWSASQLLAYKGFIWNRSDTAATWTFGEHFDDGTRVIIDGETALAYDESWNAPKLATVQLAPGPHSFEVRFAQLGGGAGPANATTQPAWTANTLAFGIDFSGSGSFDVTLFDRLDDLSDGELFTLGATDAAFDAGTLIVAPGGSISFNGHVDALVCDDDMQISAADILAGRTIAFGNADVSFAAGTTVTIADFDDLDLENTTVQRFVLIDADSISEFENLVFVPSAPKGWVYANRYGRQVVLERKLGFMLLVR